MSPDEVYAAVVDQVGAVLGASSAGLWLVRDGRTAVSLIYTSEIP